MVLETPERVVGMSAVLTMLEEVYECVSGLDAVPERSSELLHAAHLVDRCRAEILTQYQYVKGDKQPLRTRLAG